MDLGIHTALDSSAGFLGGPGQAAGEPAERLLKLDFEQLGEGNLLGTAQAFDSALGRASCSARCVAGLGVA